MMNAMHKAAAVPQGKGGGAGLGCHDCQKGGVTGRSETMCPCTNVLGPLIPNLIVPCDTMFLD